MVGIYFSGTGNTKHCMKKFVNLMSGEEKIYSIEEKNTIEEIKKQKDIVLGYPIYYSNLPKIVHDFIVQNSEIWQGKNVFIIATMGLFSGDGAGLSARLLRKRGAKIVGGLHLKMPDCIGDVKTLKKSLEMNQTIVKQAEEKINESVKKIKSGQHVKDGLGLGNHLAGLFGQRLYFYRKTIKYTDQLKVDQNKCIGCGKCVALCPMKNLFLNNGKANAKAQCTMCYRCINNCPNQALTLIGKKVQEQCRIEKYL